MPRTTTASLLAGAAAAGCGIGAFNVITLEYAEAIVAGAESADRPVVLQVSENAIRFHLGRVGPLTAALGAIAEAASVPVGLHLDHVEDEELLRASAGAGFSSVMVDAGRLPYDDNVAATARGVAWAHRHGLFVEAELGYVGGKESQAQSAHAPGVRTDPDQAADFVDATGVDALAVAVGSAHAMTSRTATLDLDLISRLRDGVPVPLVLHGSSGVPDAELGEAVAVGIVKVNVGTLLSVALTRSIRHALDADPQVVDPRKYLSPARDEMAAVVARVLSVVTPAEVPATASLDTDRLPTMG